MKKRETIKTVSRICFVIYMIVLVYLLFLSDGFGRTQVRSADYRNIIPFTEIRRFIRMFPDSPMYSVMNLLGNIAIFMPFGALIRWVINRKVYWYQAVLYTFFLSFLVELLQLVSRVGSFDIDDVILNTLGGLIGFWIYNLLKFWNKRRESKDERKCL